MPPKKYKNNDRDLERRVEHAHYIRTLRNNTPHPRLKQNRKKKIEKKDKN